MTEAKKTDAAVLDDGAAAAVSHLSIEPDTFEEFGNHEIAEEEATDKLPLWEPGWDDEDHHQLDFATKLREELDRDMKS